MNSSEPIVHTIQEGDNLYLLSKQYSTTVSAILDANPGLNPQNLRIGTNITIYPEENSNTSNTLHMFSHLSEQLTLFGNMRVVWEQHVYWTRMLMISIMERLNDEEAVTARLLGNPIDIGNQFKDFFSLDAVIGIVQLLNEHLRIGALLFTALRDEQSANVQRLQSQWYSNADQLAIAFSQLSPFYPYTQMQDMFYQHLDLTTQQATLRLVGNYVVEIQVFNQIEQEILAMADLFSSGIMKQFPQSF